MAAGEVREKPTVERSFYDGGEGGYGWIEEARKDGWRPIPSWGRDGWDLGSWPIVVYAFRERGRKFQLATYQEGDVEVYTYTTEAARTAFVDRLAEAHWRSQDEDWVRPYPQGQLPDQFKGPFSWARCDRENAAVTGGA